jgi:hypothetical protein
MDVKGVFLSNTSRMDWALWQGVSQTIAFSVDMQCVVCLSTLGKFLLEPECRTARMNKNADAKSSPGIRGLFDTVCWHADTGGIGLDADVQLC